MQYILAQERRDFFHRILMMPKCFILENKFQFTRITGKLKGR